MKSKPPRLRIEDLMSPVTQVAWERYHKILPFLSQGVPLAKLAHEEDVPVRTMWRWVHTFQRFGLAGLARKPRSDRGDRRRIPREMQNLIEGMLLEKPAPSIASVRRNLAKICEQEKWQVPSYSVIYDIAQQIDPALIMLAHEGVKAYNNAYDLVYRREATRPNEIWQADHTQLDCLVLDSSGKSRKPWLTVILDEYSRAIAGYVIGFDAPSAFGTALALRQAVWRKDDPKWHLCGLPERFYTDHGSDFTSKHIEQVSADLKFELIFSTAGQPRGRGKIERFFLTVHQIFLCHQPGYAPPGNRKAEPGPSLDGLDLAFKQWLIGEYLVQQHSETGHPPQARWEESSFLPRLLDSRDQLDLLLLTVAKPRVVHPDGIHFQGFRYTCPTLSSFVKEAVTIRYDPRDLAEIVVFSTDGRFICRAISPDLADDTVSLKSIVKARNERRRQLRSDLTDRSAVVKRYLQVHAAQASNAIPVPQNIPKEIQNGYSIKRYATD